MPDNPSDDSHLSFEFAITESTLSRATAEGEDEKDSSGTQSKNCIAVMPLNLGNASSLLHKLNPCTRAIF